jgi:hypothetical protein
MRRISLLGLRTTCCCVAGVPQVLQPPHGVVYVAAKSFYFGVGGSTVSFAELVKADGILECTQVGRSGCNCCGVVALVDK